MSQAQALYRLQEIEISLLRGQKRLAEIATALQDSQAVKQAREQAEAIKGALAPLHVKVRNLELEIQTNTGKVEATDELMYSGRVRNPKELQEMQLEIQAIKRRNEELENTLLEIMLMVEETEQVLARAEADVQQVTAAWEDQNRQLLDEQGRLQTENTSLFQQREQALRAVTADSLKQYNALKPRKQNQPMATLNGESCAVCGVEQTMAIVGEARRGQTLVSCLSCGRILVDR